LERLIADTGFLVAVGRRVDPKHEAARRFADRFHGQLVTASPTIVEACHFLSPKSQSELLDSVGRRLAVLEVPTKDYPELSATIGIYADQDIDFADASLVWLAERSGLRQILTVDVKHFSVLRLKSGKHFELIDWN